MKRVLSFGLWLTFCSSVLSDFVAFNDTVSGPNTDPNTTLYRANGTGEGFLLEILTGSPVPVWVNTTQSGVVWANSGAEPAAGTDAHTVFSGFVDFSSGGGRNIEVNNADHYTYTFTNMNPSATYEFVGTSIRGNPAYVTRWVLVTLSGADFYQPAHSTGVGIYTNGLPPNQVALWCGQNTAASQGWVVRWDNIGAGSDGEIQVVSSHYTGPIPTSVDPGGVAGGSKGYAINVFRLTETISLPGLPVVSNQPPQNLTPFSADLHGEVTDPGSNTPTVTIYYGDNDGFFFPGGWDNSVDLGIQAGMFSAGVSNLLPGTMYYFRALASNSVGERWATTSFSFTTPAAPPSVVNGAASNIMASLADVSGTVLDTGGDIPNVTLFYGRADAGTNFSWEQSLDLGGQSGAFAVNLSGLDPNTMYYFRAYATNGGGAAWAPVSDMFSTLPALPPMVQTEPSTNVAAFTALLRGTILDAGNDPTTAILYYGNIDEGTNAFAWQNSENFGVQTGAFARLVAGLEENTLYYVRAFAQNAAAGVWASQTFSFMTTTAQAFNVVINEVHYDSVSNARPNEFLEIYNPGTQAVDMTGWTFTRGVDYSFPFGSTINGGDYLIVAQDSNAFFGVYGFMPFGQWESGDRLNNDGETIRLENGAGDTIDEVDYGLSFPWPTASQGDGPSMEL
ncbi:MAG: lamin tail domain-containing protein, partial [Verrucomicrobiota bacterium]